MAWCRQATSHYLSQCWPTFMLPYDVTRPQWVKHSIYYMVTDWKPQIGLILPHQPSCCDTHTWQREISQRIMSLKFDLQTLDSCFWLIKCLATIAWATILVPSEVGKSLQLICRESLMVLLSRCLFSPTFLQFYATFWEKRTKKHLESLCTSWNLHALKD